MLKYALSGNYVNFGVFRLYGDEALDNALNMFVKLVLSVPQSDLMVSCLHVRVRLRFYLFGSCCSIIQSCVRLILVCWRLFLKTI